MSDPFRNYDSWKLDYPSEWDDDLPICSECEQELNEEDECKNKDCNLCIKE